MLVPHGTLLPGIRWCSLVFRLRVHCGGNVWNGGAFSPVPFHPSRSTIRAHSLGNLQWLQRNGIELPLNSVLSGRCCSSMQLIEESSGSKDMNPKWDNGATVYFSRFHLALTVQLTTTALRHSPLVEPLILSVSSWHFVLRHMSIGRQLMVCTVVFHTASPRHLYKTSLKRLSRHWREKQVVSLVWKTLWGSGWCLVWAYWRRSQPDKWGHLHACALWSGSKGCCSPSCSIKCPWCSRVCFGRWGRVGFRYWQVWTACTVPSGGLKHR